MKLRIIYYPTTPNPDLPQTIGAYSFYCPGCKHNHIYYVNQSQPHINWNFNGDLEFPTFTPSLKNTAAYTKYRDYDIENPDGTKSPRPDEVCHLYVTNGVIEYCGDCTHELAGQKVPMHDLPEEPDYGNRD